MTSSFKGSELSAEHQIQIWALIKRSDNEFIPPLSKRTGVSQTDFSTEGCLADYIKDIIKCNFIISEINGKVVGFIAYKAVKENTYVCTIIVDKKYRNQGIGEKLHLAMFYEIPLASVIAKTWSTNVEYISLLDKLEFNLLKRVDNDRCDGIDTLYYTKELK